MRYILFLAIIVVMVISLWYCSTINIDPSTINPSILGYKTNTVSSLIDPSKISPVFMTNW